MYINHQLLSALRIKMIQLLTSQMIGHKHWLSCNDIVAHNMPRKPIMRNINHMTISPQETQILLLRLVINS